MNLLELFPCPVELINHVLFCSWWHITTCKCTHIQHYCVFRHNNIDVLCYRIRLTFNQIWQKDVHECHIFISISVATFLQVHVQSLLFKTCEIHRIQICFEKLQTNTQSETLYSHLNRTNTSSEEGQTKNWKQKLNTKWYFCKMI